MALFRVLLAAAILGTTPSAAIQLFRLVADIPEAVPIVCRAYLHVNITCTDFLVSPQRAANGETLGGEAASMYCGDPCASSMAKFAENVIKNCGTTPYQLWMNSTVWQTGKAIADGLTWAQKLVCTKDE